MNSSKQSTQPSASKAGDTKNKHTSPDSRPRQSRQQQLFVLKFCRQLASVIQACEHSESAEIEIGRRHIGDQQVRVKLQADREHHSD